MSTPVAEPLSVSGLLAQTRRLLEAHPVQLLLPFVILGIVTSGGDDPSFRMDKDLDFDMDGRGPGPSILFLLPFFALAFVLALLIAALLFLVYTLVSLVVADATLAQLRGGPHPSWSASFANVKPSFWGAAGTFLLWLGVVIVGFLLLIVPGFIAMSGLLPVTAVVVAERRYGMDALKRTWELTKGHKGTMFLLVLLAIAVNLVASALAFLPFIGNALAGALNGAVYAALLVATVVFYHHIVPPAPAPPEAAPPTFV